MIDSIKHNKECKEIIRKSKISEMLVFRDTLLPGGKKMKIETDPETDKIINRIGRMGEKPADVIRRGFAYLDGDSNFFNQE